MKDIREETNVTEDGKDIWIWINDENPIHATLDKAKKPNETDKVWVTVWMRGIDGLTVYQ